MQYMVVGADGKEYGPVDMPTLQQWAQENRLTPQSQLKDFATGQVMPASQVSGLFGPVAGAAPNTAQPPAPNPYAQNYQQPYQPVYNQRAQSDDMGIIWGVIFRSIAGVVFFFLLHGIGLIFAGYALFLASQAKSNGHSHGTLAIVISGIAFAAVAIGWVMRISTGGSF